MRRLPRSGVDDVGFISALTDALVREYDIDPRWVFATGLSNGAFMVNRLACDLPEKIAAVAPVARTLGTDVECSPAVPVAVMSVHGTDDPLVPFEGGPMAGRGGTSTILPAGRPSSSTPAPRAGTSSAPTPEPAADQSPV
ncbi:MAG: hypothetical protein WBL35_02825 [Ornithinibacter sp.]